MNIILFDGPNRKGLLPLVFAMPVADLRFGIDTFKEKWEHHFPAAVSYQTQNYLASSFPSSYADNNTFVYGGLYPKDEILSKIKSLNNGEGLYKGDFLLAANLSGNKLDASLIVKKTQVEEELLGVHRPWDLFRYNDQAIALDFDRITAGRKSQELDASVTAFGDKIFVEEGAKLKACILNAESGPIYIGKNAEIMEGSVVRGALALCESATLKLSAKIYGATTIGPHSKVGGEVNNSVIWGYSNKGHDGFLGNSVLGKWCNLGADTNNSNLKNNYGSIKLWSYEEESLCMSDMQFCGLIMGDHSKTGINTMLNTGTTVGYAANIFGGGFPPKFIPSFSWGGADGFVTFKLEKAYEVAQKMMERRGIDLSEDDKQQMQHIFDFSSKYRS